MDNVLKILQIISIIAPHIAKTLQVVSHEDGSADLVMHLSRADAGFDKTLQLIEEWRTGNQ